MVSTAARMLELMAVVVSNACVDHQVVVDISDFIHMQLAAAGAAFAALVTPARQAKLRQVALGQAQLRK
jgi:hypothetical protein